MGPKRTVEWTASVGLYPMEVELRQHPYERSGKLGWCRRMGPSICTGIDQVCTSTLDHYPPFGVGAPPSDTSKKRRGENRFLLLFINRRISIWASSRMTLES
ncbi:hypothetical protein BDV35DRAFT_333494 [Aspergillus flavus]|uniref:Uncharacterized protein n=1 Tax=Aspergillus flavus TaxID=5059 RepID=A0A5N6HFM2_ASPFL|nr:hypothetical protein BDV35DRAFT_333494 [Aspergillus flavus]